MPELWLPTVTIACRRLASSSNAIASQWALNMRDQYGSLWQLSPAWSISMWADRREAAAACHAIISLRRVRSDMLVWVLSSGSYSYPPGSSYSVKVAPPSLEWSREDGAGASATMSGGGLGTA